MLAQNFRGFPGKPETGQIHRSQGENVERGRPL